MPNSKGNQEISSKLIESVLEQKDFCPGVLKGSECRREPDRTSTPLMRFKSIYSFPFQLKCAPPDRKEVIGRVSVAFAEGTRACVCMHTQKRTVSTQGGPL